MISVTDGLKGNVLHGLHMFAINKTMLSESTVGTA